MSRQRVFLSALCAALIAALLAALYAGSQRTQRMPQAAAALTTEALAPLFASHFEDAYGKLYSFSSWRGKTLLVNFWATWCPPCREEMPVFSRLQDRYATRGVQFVGIALDSADKVRVFAESHPLSYPLLIGGSAGVELAGQLGNHSLSLPFTVLISADRDLLLVRLGPLSENELDLLLQRSLAR